jgi:hypothetical protein
MTTRDEFETTGQHAPATADEELATMGFRPEEYRSPLFKALRGGATPDVELLLLLRSADHESRE